MDIIVQSLIALVVAAHGLVYLNGGLGRLAGLFEGWKGRSLLLRGTISTGRLKQLTRTLWIVAGIGTIATGIAIALDFYAQGLWRPLAIVASAVAIMSFAAFWDGQGRRSVNQGIIGMILSLIILAGAIAFPQPFG